MSENAKPDRPVTIRNAHRNDIDKIRCCLEDAFAPFSAAYTDGAFRDTVPTRATLTTRLRKMRTFVAVDADGRIVGTISCAVAGRGDGHLRGMAVLRQRQGTGVASLLLDAAVNELREQGCVRVTLDTTEPLQRAIAFYRAHGFNPTGRVEDFFGMQLHEYALPLEREP